MPDKYIIQDIGGICHYLLKYRERTDEWQADFYSMDDVYICSFTSDEETKNALLDDDTLYAMVTEMVDFIIMMGGEFDL